jgi:hypothetical protein
MHQRWYDNDPTLSMAVSLLQNAHKAHQELTARYIFRQLAAENLLESDILNTSEDRVRFIFPKNYRQKLDVRSRHLLEVLKLLPSDVQQRMAVQIIQYVYMLDADDQERSTLALLEPEPDGLPKAQPESG